MLRFTDEEAPRSEHVQNTQLIIDRVIIQVWKSSSGVHALSHSDIGLLHIKTFQ